MGILHRQNQAIKKLEKKRVDDFLSEIGEVSKKHKLVLAPMIGKYKAQFEIRDYPKETDEAIFQEVNKEK